eukprot:jgi/Chrzof1/3784/Cz13g08190.t1
MHTCSPPSGHIIDRVTAITANTGATLFYKLELSTVLNGSSVLVSHESSASVSHGPSVKLQVARCMSCDLDCPVLLGVTGHDDDDDVAGPVSRDSLIKETKHMRCWLDAKARPLFVITPKLHHERLLDLSDDELVDLFRSAVGLLAEMGCPGFNSMILNHGTRRNHAHLHLKIRIQQREFDRAINGWSQEVRSKLMVLKRFVQEHVPAPAQGARGTRQAWLLRQRQQQQHHHHHQQQYHHQQQHQPQDEQPGQQQQPKKQRS